MSKVSRWVTLVLFVAGCTGTIGEQQVEGESQGASGAPGDPMRGTLGSSAPNEPNAQNAPNEANTTGVGDSGTSNASNGDPLPIAPTNEAGASGEDAGGAGASGAGKDAGQASSDAGMKQDGSASAPVDAGGGGGTTVDPYAAARDLCVQTINDYRATVSRTALQRWTSAEACTDGQAQTDSESNVAHSAFGQCTEYAQNECPGWSGTLETTITGCLEAMWNEGPGGGHYENMAASNRTKVSCGIYKTPAGKWWLVQNFR